MGALFGEVLEREVVENARVTQAWEEAQLIVQTLARKANAVSVVIKGGGGGRPHGGADHLGSRGPTIVGGRVDGRKALDA